MINLIPYIEGMQHFLQYVPIFDMTLDLSAGVLGHRAGKFHRLAEHEGNNWDGAHLDGEGGNASAQNRPDGASTWETQAEKMRLAGMSEAAIAAELSAMSPKNGYYSDGDVASVIYSWETGYGAEQAAVEGMMSFAEQQLALTSSIVSRQLSLAEQEAQIAQEQWNHYKQVYKPGEIAFVEEAFAGIPAEPYIEAAGAEVRQAFSQEQEMASQELQRMGLDPSSPKYAQILGDVDTARAAAEAGAKTQARAQIEAENYARKRDVVGLGKGLPSEAATAAAAGGSILTGAGSTAAQGAQGMYGAYGQMGGMGAQQTAMQHDVGMANLTGEINAPSDLDYVLQGVNAIGSFFGL